MKELEWQSCNDPVPMVQYLEGKASDRKLMLFSIACLRRIWHLLTDDRSRRLIDVTDQFIAGQASEEDACRAYDRFLEAYDTDQLRDSAGGNTHDAVEAAAHRGALAAAEVAANVSDAIGYVAANAILPITPTEARPAAHFNSWTSAQQAERSIQAELLREIIGNPFRSVHIKPCWLTPEVLGMAQAISEERSFQRMPELAELLQAAGCDDQNLLAHCRKPSTHVPGCWVIDLLLGEMGTLLSNA